MHTIIHPSTPASRRSPESPSITPNFRQPSYDCREYRDAVQLTVYIPGVEAAGVEIEARGPDLVVTARKTHFVRVNWQALHLETAQKDYRLRLRLGDGLDYPALHAEVDQGVLTVLLPKRPAAAERLTSRRVA
jgi:HSP20 family molecular chaperone IbpA